MISALGAFNHERSVTDLVFTENGHYSTGASTTPLEISSVRFEDERDVQHTKHPINYSNRKLPPNIRAHPVRIHQPSWRQIIIYIRYIVQFSIESLDEGNLLRSIHCHHRFPLWTWIFNEGFGGFGIFIKRKNLKV